MIEFLELVLYHLTILIQASPLISIAQSQRCITHFYERSATRFSRDTEEFFNPKITKVEVTVERMPNELYAQNMEYRHQYDEILKHFGEGRLEEAGAIQKNL